MNTLNTTANSIFFSRALNLIFSVRYFTSKPIHIIVWDIGLSNFENYLLKLLKVEVIKVPNFIHFWEDCYTWKTFIYHTSSERIFLHLDAGNTVLCDIDEIFNIIQDKGYFFVDQGFSLEQITPPDYFRHFNVGDYRKYSVVAAGNIGIDKDNVSLSIALRRSYESALKGMCLGFSSIERNRSDRSDFILRECEVFRHDQTVLNCCLRAEYGDFDILPFSKYSALALAEEVKIFNQRKRSYKFLLIDKNCLSILLFCYCCMIDKYYFLSILFFKVCRRLSRFNKR